MFSVLSMTFRIWSTVKLGISRGRILRISHAVSHPRGVRTQNLKAWWALRRGKGCNEHKETQREQGPTTFENMVAFFCGPLNIALFFKTIKGTSVRREFTHLLILIFCANGGFRLVPVRPSIFGSHVSNGALPCLTVS